jgi:hypothetical protein
MSSASSPETMVVDLDGRDRVVRAFIWEYSMLLIFRVMQELHP